MCREGNPFLKKYLASAYVHNGFGKTCGLVQVQEIGTLETPIALTNTLNVGKVADAMISWMIQQTRKEGEDVFSINPVVGECNDSRINEICNRVVGKKSCIRHWSRRIQTLRKVISVPEQERSAMG